MDLAKKIAHLVYDFIRRLSDVRFLGQTAFVVIVLLISWSTASAIQQNYEVQQRVATKQKEVEVQKLKNQNLVIKNKYLETDEYLEITARRQLGKGLPGESVVIIPKEVALKHTIESSIKSSDKVQEQAEQERPWYRRNLDAWGKFFFRN